MRYILIFIFSVVIGTSLDAQINPVQWNFEAKRLGADKVEVVATAKMDGEWALYSQKLPEDGPIPTAFSLKNGDKYEDVQFQEPAGKTVFDAMFEMEIKKFKKEVVFTYQTHIGPDQQMLEGDVRFMTCDDKQCLMPKTIPFKVQIN